MNILKKSFIFAMPAMMTTACDDVRNYVITYKDDQAKEIEFVAVGDPDEEHIMIFDLKGRPQDSTMFKYLKTGDTLSTYYTGNPVISPHYWTGAQDTKMPYILKINGRDAKEWTRAKIAAAEQEKQKQLMHQELNRIRSRQK